VGGYHNGHMKIEEKSVEDTGLQSTAGRLSIGRLGGLEAQLSQLVHHHLGSTYQWSEG
jgi:hypothetical protein